MGRALSIETRDATGKSVPWDLPMNGILSLTLHTQGRRKFGGRMKAMVSGGAPLNPDVGLFFQAMGLTMLQGYGQTEAGPVISCNRPERGHPDGHGRPAAAQHRGAHRRRRRDHGARRDS